jgi:hypothetical protein
LIGWPAFGVAGDAEDARRNPTGPELMKCVQAVPTPSTPEVFDYLTLTSANRAPTGLSRGKECPPVDDD